MVSTNKFIATRSGGIFQAIINLITMAWLIRTPWGHMMRCMCDPGPEVRGVPFRLQDVKLGVEMTTFQNIYILVVQNDHSTINLHDYSIYRHVSQAYIPNVEYNHHLEVLVLALPKHGFGLLDSMLLSHFVEMEVRILCRTNPEVDLFLIVFIEV